MAEGNKTQDIDSQLRMKREELKKLEAEKRKAQKMEKIKNKNEKDIMKVKNKERRVRAKNFNRIQRISKRKSFVNSAKNNVNHYVGKNVNSAKSFTDKIKQKVSKAYQKGKQFTYHSAEYANNNKAAQFGKATAATVNTGAIQPARNISKKAINKMDKFNKAVTTKTEVSMNSVGLKDRSKKAVYNAHYMMAAGDEVKQKLGSKIKAGAEKIKNSKLGQHFRNTANSFQEKSQEVANKRVAAKENAKRSINL